MKNQSNNFNFIWNGKSPLKTKHNKTDTENREDIGGAGNYSINTNNSTNKMLCS